MPANLIVICYYPLRNQVLQLFVGARILFIVVRSECFAMTLSFLLECRTTPVLSKGSDRANALLFNKGSLRYGITELHP